MTRQSALASPTYTTVRTRAGRKNASGPTMWSQTKRNWVTSQSTGFHTGTGCRRTGSTPPNRMASTTYSGATSSSAVQATPGSASNGQRRRPRGWRPPSATGLELLPDLVVRRVCGGRQLVQRHPGGEVALLDDGGGEVLGHVAVGHQGL